jgi:hypothetical protein
LTLADGITTVQGFMVRAQEGTATELPAFRAPGDPMGYHEAQQGSQCALHTLNMVDPGGSLATQEEYTAFLTAKYTAKPPKVPEGGDFRDATPEEIDHIANQDAGTSLMVTAEFQAWRRQQPGGEGLTDLKAGNGAVNDDSAFAQARQVRISVNVTGDFGNVTDAGAVLRCARKIVGMVLV